MVESTIKEIRENQAEKEKTKDIRKKLVQEHEAIQQIDPENDERIKRKIEKLKQKEKNRGNKKKVAPTIQPKAKEIQKVVFASGDKIRLKESGSVGEIIDVDKNKVVVALGNLMTTTSLNKIEHISHNEVKKIKRDAKMQPKADSLQRTNHLLDTKLKFKPDIDVR
ncbi:MAG: hypothetical protein PF541_16240 [Prolixibacteraceae bacterium]|nr:hypothetical protein [Prolixibacteraceae bacterium]